MIHDFGAVLTRASNGSCVRYFTFTTRLRQDDGSMSMTAFGHSGLGGSLAFCDPASGVAVCVLVNRLMLQPEATSRVVSLVTSQLGAGEWVR